MTDTQTRPEVKLTRAQAAYLRILAEHPAQAIEAERLYLYRYGRRLQGSSTSVVRALNALAAHGYVTRRGTGAQVTLAGLDRAEEIAGQVLT